MEPDAEIEARTQELCNMRMEVFTQIVQQEYNGNLDELTVSALAQSRVVERWYKVLGQEYRAVNHQISTLLRHSGKKDTDRKHQRLTARKHAIMRRLSDVEWVVKRLTEDKSAAAKQQRNENKHGSIRKEALRRLANRYSDDLRVILEELLAERQQPNPELATRIRNWML